MRKNIFITILLAAILIIGASCKRCDNCLHGGSCGTNGCDCPDPWSGRNCDTSCSLGYEGYHCATFSKSRFFGTWDCNSKDPLGNNMDYEITFTNDPSQPTRMYLSNFNEKGYKISCVLTGKTKFDIPQQFATGSLHASVSGYALMHGSKLTLYITEDGVEYFGTATQQ